jgi:hypothetical protein
VQGNCAIERKLDEGIERIAEEAKEVAQNMGPHGYPSRHNGRIPSWLALPQLTAFPSGAGASASGHESPSRAASAAVGNAMVSLAAAPGRHHNGLDSPQPVAVSAPRRAVTDTRLPFTRNRVDNDQNGHSEEPEPVDAVTGRERDLDVRENGSAVISALSSSGEGFQWGADKGAVEVEEVVLERGRSPRQLPRRNSSGGSLLPGQSCVGGSMSPQHSSRSMNADGTRRPYGAAPDGPSWRGLRLLAQTVERTVGLGGRQCSSYALDVMAP